MVRSSLSGIKALVVCALSVMMVGCSARIIPPASVPRPQIVLVTDYGRHSSLLLPDDNGRLEEFMYGDWKWFALGDTHWYDGVQALFFSEGATMGKRSLDFGADANELSTRIGCVNVLRITVDSPEVRTLREQLNGRIEQHISTIVHNSKNGCDFVQDDEHYSLWNNCNHLTARWLTELGCQIEGDPMTSKFTLEGEP
jgi:hypothetical protein